METMWFFVALGAPLLWAVGSFIDKFLVDRLKSEELSMAVLLLYSTLFSVLVLPVVFLIGGGLDTLFSIQILLLIAAGVVEAVALFLFFSALVREEVSLVIPLLQLTPVFSFAFGLLVLGETLTLLQGVGCVTVILGGMLLTLEFSEETRFKIKKYLLVYMIFAAAAYALTDTLFKYGGSANAFWTSVFWQHVGLLGAGVAVFLAKPSYRRQFVSHVQASPASFVGLNILNETLHAGGVMLVNFALFFAPIALVATVTAYHPVFVLIGGAMLTMYFPKLISEKLSARHLIHKSVATLVVVLGSVLLLI